MKIYDINGNLKWTKRVKWLKATIIFVLIIAVLFPFLYFLVGASTELLRAILTSLAISTIITAGYVYSCVLAYERVTAVIENKKLYLIIEQREKDFYYTNIKLKRNIDYEDKELIKKLLTMNEKITGIAIFEAKKCDIIKEKNDRYKVSVEGTYNKWKYYDNKKDFGYELKKYDNKRIITINNKNDDYKELINYIK